MQDYSKITDLRQRKLAFLTDTAHHYNSNNRSTANNDGCFYAPAHANTAGCAIGRHLPIETAKNFDNYKFATISAISTCNELKNLIPNWMMEMGIAFLELVQELHDIDDNWNENGLSEDGVKAFNSIKFKL